MERKKKIRFIQLSLLIVGFLVIVFTYTKIQIDDKDQIITSELQKKIKEQIDKGTEDGDVFYNIEYTGLDLSGNRYILKADQATNKSSDQEVVVMKAVNAIFYFKDETILKVVSDAGVYNNKTLDMIFEGNVKAEYEQSKLFAEKAEFSNSDSYLIISKNVRVEDAKGTINADRLLFDIKEQTLNIASLNNRKINANINVK